MYLDERQKKIVKRGIEDYNFIKEQLEEKIKKGYTLEDLSVFLTRFKDIEITNLESYDDTAYLDFIYKDVNTYCMWTPEDNVIVSSSFEIYDKDMKEYIVEDYWSIEKYEKMLNRTREENLNDFVLQLKWYESRNLDADYKAYCKKVISFLKENW